MTNLNLWVAWWMIFAGVVTGAIQGLYFHDNHWLGGYGSWQRRIMRLGHIAFFGLALINLAFVYTVDQLGLTRGIAVPSILLAAANLLMPIICFASAWRKPIRHLFFIPTGCTLLGILGLIIAGMIQ